MFLILRVIFLAFSLFYRKTNIFDNIVYMMEKYADNLEELVMERTGQLIEEKKKTEALLERMLPRFVLVNTFPNFAQCEIKKKTVFLQKRHRRLLNPLTPRVKPLVMQSFLIFDSMDLKV